MYGALSTTRPFSAPKLPGFGRAAFVGGSVLAHVGAALLLPAVVAPLSPAPAAPTLVEFTLAAPEPTPPVQIDEVAEVAEPAVLTPPPRRRAMPDRPATPKPATPKPATPKATRPEPPPVLAAAAPATSTSAAVESAPVEPAPAAVQGGTLAVGAQAQTPSAARTESAPLGTPPVAEPGPRVDLGQLKRSYLKRLTRVLHKHRRYPSLALRERLEGTVLVSITIDAAGQIRDVALRRSSGHALLDRSALAAVRATPSVPVPPADMGWRTHSVTLPIAYVLQ